MLLVREVYGWLRHLLNCDPLARETGIVVEEIPSTFTAQGDSTDGSRTLAIHRVAEGMTPRIEVRFTGLRPQVFWYDNDAPNGSLITHTNQYATVPGDWKSWDCSDFCNYLLLAAKARLCAADKIVEVVEAANYGGKAVKWMTPDEVLTTLEAVHRAFAKKAAGGTDKTIDDQVLDAWLKKKGYGDLFSFMHSVFRYFAERKPGKYRNKEGVERTRKVEWDDIDMLETAIDPKGFNVFDFDVLKRNLDLDQVGKLLPPPVVDALQQKKAKQQTASTARYLEEKLAHLYKGKKPEIFWDKVHLGTAAVVAFRQGVAPMQYLEEFERLDSGEEILPWSMLRRSIFAYNYCTVAAKDDLAKFIVEWLESSDLLLPLYHEEDENEAALKDALAVQLDNFVDRTVGSEPYIRALLETLSYEQSDLMRALQSEFDLWLFDALSPAVEKWRLPLSPYAFSTDKKDQKLYDKMYGSWLKYLLDYQKGQKEKLVDNLKEAFEKFYSTLGQQWNAELFQDYKPPIPPVAKILELVQTAEPGGLFKVLVGDLEAEIGSPCPDVLANEMVLNPFFLGILRELRLQSIQFPLPLAGK